MFTRLAAASIGFTMAGAALVACTTTPRPAPEPIVTTVQVPVPVASPCVPATLGPPPAYPDTDAALRRPGNNAADRYQLMGAGRRLRIGRLAEIEAVVAGCPREPTK